MARHAGEGSASHRALLAAVLLVALAASWWAGRVTFRSPQTNNAIQQEQQLVTTVRDGSVGQSLSLNVTVKQPFQSLAPASIVGIVTAVPLHLTGNTGEVVYRVNNVPIRVVQGTTPFYRALRPGLLGPDVAELQAALVALNYLSGTPSGIFDSETADAVKKWQITLDQPQTGTIAMGELIAAPKLPAPLRLGDGVVIGNRLDGSSPAVLAPTGKLTFQLVVSQQQAALIPSTATVQIDWQNHSWQAIVAASNPLPSDSSTLVLELTAPGGGLPCGTDCGSLPPNASMSLLSSIQVVPQMTGPAIPAAAVHTDGRGGTYVLLVDGSHRSVTVDASASGVAIVKGLKDGEQVLALGGTSDGGGTATSTGSSGGSPTSTAPSGGSRGTVPSR